MANNDPKSLHDRDSSAASDPLANYYSHWIKESNGELKSVGMSLVQLIALLGGNAPPTPVSGTFLVAMTGVNTTIASYLGSFTDSYDRHYVSVNDTAAPTAVTDGVAGPASGIVDLGDYDQKTVRMWTGVLDGSSAGITWTQRDPDASGDDGSQGFSTQATANQPATFTGSLSFDDTQTTTTTAVGTAVPATILGGATLQVDLVNTYNGNNVLISDVTDFTADGLLPVGLNPDTLYGMALLAYPVSEGPTSSRAKLSNIVEVMTDAVSTVLSIDSFDATIPADSTTLTISTFSYTATGITNLEWGVSYDSALPTAWTDGTPDTGGTTTIDVSARGQGQNAIWLFLRDKDDPTKYVRSSPVIFYIVVTGTTDVFSLDLSASTLVLRDNIMEIGKVRIRRSNKSATAINVPITSSDGTAIAGTNYVRLDAVVPFSASDDYKDVDIESIVRLLGHIDGVPVTENFAVTLGTPSAGSLASTDTSATITIQGSDGYLPAATTGPHAGLPAIDPLRPPTNLTRITNPVTVTAADTLYDLVEIDAAGKSATAFFILKNGAARFKLRRFIAKNLRGSLVRFEGWAPDVTLQNGYVQDWHMGWKEAGGPVYSDNMIVDAYPLKYAAQSGQNINNLSVCGVFAVGHGRFIVTQYTGGSTGFIFENNTFNNTFNRDLGNMTRKEYVDTYYPGSVNDPLRGPRDGTMVMIWFPDGGGGNNRVRGNLTNSRRFGSVSGHSMDLFNAGDKQCNNESRRSFWEFNVGWGSSGNHINPEHTGSATGMICDSVTAKGNPQTGFNTSQHNTMIESQNAGGAFNDGQGTVQRLNEMYCGPNSLETHENGVGVGPGVPGTYSSTRVNQENFTMWYKWLSGGAVVVNNVYSSGGEPAGYLNNPGQYIQNGANGQEDWINNGETLVKGRYRLWNCGGYDHGFRPKFASAGHAGRFGNGSLRWDDTLGALFYKSPRDTNEGPASPVNQAVIDARYGEWQSRVRVYSYNQAEYIDVAINPVKVAALTADHVYRIAVTPHLFADASVHTPAHDQREDGDAAGFQGDYIAGLWGGTDEIAVSGPASGAPNSPSPIVATGAADHIGLTCANQSGSGAVKYYWYRDKYSSPTSAILEKIAETVSNSYDDYAVSVGDTYTYAAAAVSADVPPQVSVLTPIDTASLTSSAAGILPDLTDTGSWTYVNLDGANPVTDNGDGTFTMKKDGTGNLGYAYIDLASYVVPGSSFTWNFNNVAGGWAAWGYNTIPHAFGYLDGDSDVLGGYVFDGSNRGVRTVTKTPSTANIRLIVAINSLTAAATCTCGTPFLTGTLA